MRIYNRSHPPSHDEDYFALQDDIRQRIRNQEVGGTPSKGLFLHASANFSLLRIVLEDLYLFFPWR